MKWGQSGDIPVPGDYDGDWVMDIAFYRPGNGKWYSPVFGCLSWGSTGDIPVPGDFNGDGLWDPAVLRPTSGKWYIKVLTTYSWYAAGDYPLPTRDRDGDGQPD